MGEAHSTPRCGARCRWRACKPGDRVLEIGCGWGALAEMAAREFGASRDRRHAVAPSSWPSRRRGCAAPGVGTRPTCGCRTTATSTDAPFDAICSIEMVEAVGREYWPDYFETVQPPAQAGRPRLHPEHRDRRRAVRALHRLDRLHPAVHLPGRLPALPARVPARRPKQRACEVVDEFAFGADYAETLRRWRERFLAQRSPACCNSVSTKGSCAYGSSTSPTARRRSPRRNIDVVQYTLRKPDAPCCACATCCPCAAAGSGGRGWLAPGQAHAHATDAAPHAACRAGGPAARCVSSGLRGLRRAACGSRRAFAPSDFAAHAVRARAALPARLRRATTSPALARARCARLGAVATGAGRSAGERQLAAALPDVQRRRPPDRRAPARAGRALPLPTATPRGEIADAAVRRRFFGIWLAPQTSEPALREALLAQRSGRAMNGMPRSSRASARADGLRYGLLGLPLAFVALPLYVLLPNHYARALRRAAGHAGRRAAGRAPVRRA